MMMMKTLYRSWNRQGGHYRQMEKINMYLLYCLIIHFIPYQIQKENKAGTYQAGGQTQ